MRMKHLFKKGYDSEVEEVTWGIRYAQFHADPNGYFLIRVNLELSQIEVALVRKRRIVAKVYGKKSMIGALRGIDRWVSQTQFQPSSQDALATMKISGNSSGFMHLLATHPPIEERVAALEQL